MGYGSLFATVITLFLVPLCYLAVDDVGRGFKFLFSRPAERSPEPVAA
jgi:hypothetical protein